MENDPFEDVFPIENGDFPLLCLITGVYINIRPYFWGGYVKGGLVDQS